MKAPLTLPEAPWPAAIYTGSEQSGDNGGVKGLGSECSLRGGAGCCRDKTSKSDRLRHDHIHEPKSSATALVSKLLQGQMDSGPG